MNKSKLSKPWIHHFQLSEVNYIRLGSGHWSPLAGVILRARCQEIFCIESLTCHPKACWNLKLRQNAVNRNMERKIAALTLSRPGWSNGHVLIMDTNQQRLPPYWVRDPNKTTRPKDRETKIRSDSITIFLHRFHHRFVSRSLWTPWWSLSVVTTEPRNGREGQSLAGSEGM